MTQISSQQEAVLIALRQQSPLPTPILCDVRAEPYKGAGVTHRIGEPVGAVLRRLEKRGLVTGERDGQYKDWWISDAGLHAIEGQTSRTHAGREGA